MINASDTQAGSGEWQNVCPVPDDFPLALDCTPASSKDWKTARSRALEARRAEGGAVYEYRNTEGAFLFYVLRTLDKNGKRLSPLTAWENKQTGEKEWRLKGGVIKPAATLYRLERLAQYPDKPVLFVEGEKCVEAAELLFPDYVCVTLFGGCGMYGKFPEALLPLHGRRVVFWPDDDKPTDKEPEGAGKSAMQRVATLLRGVAMSLSWVDVAKIKVAVGAVSDKWDCADFKAQGCTREMLEAIEGWLMPESTPTALPETNGGEVFVLPACSEERAKAVGATNANIADDSRGFSISHPQDWGTPLSGVPDIGDSFFKMRSRYLWVLERPKIEKGQPTWIKVCSSFVVEGRCVGENGEGYGYVIRFPTSTGEWQRWILPAGLIGEKGVAFYALFDERLGIFMRRQSANHVAGYVIACGEYFFQRNAIPILCFNKTGWHEDAVRGRVFVTPSSVVSSDGIQELFCSDGDLGYLYSESKDVCTKISAPKQKWVAGTLHDWQQSVAKKAEGNRWGVFAIAASLAACCLDTLRLPSFVVHWWGNSSTGKSSLAFGAASVWGCPKLGEFTSDWDITMVGLANLMVSRTGMPTILDELQKCSDMETLKKFAYTVSNEKSRTKSERTMAVNREVHTWQTIAISNGENSFQKHLGLYKVPMRSGMEARLLDLPVEIDTDNNGNFTVWENVHGAASHKSFSEEFERAAKENYGHAGLVFAEFLLADDNRLYLKGKYAQAEKYLLALLPSDEPVSGGVLGRAVRCFAAIAAAGEAASAHEITGWPVGHALSMVGLCFLDWVCARGFLGVSLDMNLAEEAFLHELLTELHTCYTHFHIERIDKHPGDVGSAPHLTVAVKGKTKGLAFFKGIENASSEHDEKYLAEVWVYKAVFEDFCTRQGVPTKHFGKHLADGGYLTRGSDSQGSTRLVQFKRQPGVGRMPFYIFKGSALGGVEAEG